MKILGNGYLSADGRALAQKVVGDNQAGFDALLRSIEQFRSFAATREVARQESDAEKQRVIALILAARLLEISEAAYLVMLHGMSTEANSLFRVFLDAYFVFGNICSSEEFVAEYFNSDEANRLKLINAAKKHSSELFKPANEGISEEHRSNLKDRVEGEKIQTFNSHNYAAKIGCEGIYDSMYRLLSSAVHTSPRALVGYSEEDASGIVLSARDGPSEGDIPQRLHGFAYFIIKTLSGLQEVFECLDQAEIERLTAGLNKCQKSNITISRWRLSTGEVNRPGSLDIRQALKKPPTDREPVTRAANLRSWPLNRRR
nr:DUF5677 domain-containing protein [uncultured Halomonas sp.]